MIHAILYVIFIVPFTAWFGYELKRKYSLQKHWLWIGGAFVTGIFGTLLSKSVGGTLGNFLLHASGGVASTLLFVYFTRTLNMVFPWRLTLVLLIAFVSTLGVLNELAEFFVEAQGWMIMSFDSQDTWRDFVANSLGAVLAWLGVNVFWQIRTFFKP